MVSDLSGRRSGRSRTKWLGKLRQIEVQSDLRVRFPTRGAEFDDGVELGMAMARMADFSPRVEVKLSAGSIEQLRQLAQRLSYRLSIEETEGEVTLAVLEPAHSRPRLRLVSAR